MRTFEEVSYADSIKHDASRPSFTEPQKHDDISHPKHYTQGIECWDYIESHGMSYLQGNIIKYVTRYQYKDGVKDLKKARAYLDKLIATLEQER